MNTHRWMSMQYFSFFMTWGIFLPYWTGWMVHTKGISISEASFIMSLGLLARGLSTLFIFPYLSGKFSSKILLRGAGIGTLFSLICYIPATSFASLLVITLLFHLFYPPLMPALDSAAGVLVQNKQLAHYGKSRQWGSIGFVVGGTALSFFTGSFGDQVILWAVVIGILLFLFLGTLQPPVILAKKPQGNELQKAGLLALFKTRHFGLVLSAVILLQAAHASYYNYGYLYLQDIGASKYFIGIIINIAVIAEIIFFANADKTFQRFSVGSLLALAALGSTLRWILVFVFPNVVVFSFAQLLHACSFAMGHYAFMKYLIKNIPHAQIPKAQGVYSALALSWSTAVLTIFGGFLYEIEPRYAFIGMLVSTIPSLILALIYRKKARNIESLLLRQAK